MDPKVIFEDKHLLILDKPAGWITNEVKTKGSTPTIEDWLKKNFDYPVAKSAEYRSGIVHRLDKETSGVLVVAKTSNAFQSLQTQFKRREIKKTYIALVHGEFEPREGEIEAPVGRLPWNRERFGVLPGGREANTGYKVLNYYSLATDHRSPFTLGEFFPKTGRTHQIRIHLKYLGHPIVSDEFYAGRKTARADRKWCPRLFLHAKSISVRHPEKDTALEFKSELPDGLKKALSFLVKQNSLVK
ncbi:MAG: Pseudouridine synthase [Candidatus Woesebacteria bacterium GW2011_GWB1_39_12]|uniref:Pseudouridine synthase n=2 Tax=Candidatus Woeseibacteriota TaxID=1752722 RepID=A0A0G0M5K7_9BACT|nr:MAG: Pseudouridine synthase [Candidatus Woesebacteria bacterium GW2011_GWA1_39_12]KKR00690.1 MAG: Pseudouridine synthase [Candidatus Woesebacteria bacterium GW2011_GWB1_39_12]